MGGTGIAFHDADKSQLAMAESPASDRIAFALSLLETGLRMRSAEKSRDSAPVLSGAVRSLRSGLLRNNREKLAYFAYFRGNDGGISLQLRLLAERVGLDFRHLPQVVVKTRHSDFIQCLCWFQALS